MFQVGKKCLKKNLIRIEKYNLKKGGWEHSLLFLLGGKKMACKKKKKGK